MLHFSDSKYKLQSKRLETFTESFSPLKSELHDLTIQVQHVESTSIDTQYNVLTSVTLHVIIENINLLLCQIISIHYLIAHLHC